MADQKDQDPTPPAEKPTFLPLKKRAIAEKELVGVNRASESESESEYSDSSDDGNAMDSSGEEFKKPTLQELQRKAYYSVLQAFKLETSTISNKRTQIIEKLMKMWKIAEETHISFVDKIQKDLLTLQERDDSSHHTIVPKSGSSWGSVNPESLIGKWVRIRLPGEADFEEFIIKTYDAKQEMHGLVIANSNAMEIDNPLSLMDLREISPEDIMWENGVKPNFDAPNQSTSR